MPELQLYNTGCRGSRNCWKIWQPDKLFGCRKKVGRYSLLPCCSSCLYMPCKICFFLRSYPVPNTHRPEMRWDRISFSLLLMLVLIYLDLVYHFLCVTSGQVKFPELQKPIPEGQMGNYLQEKISWSLLVTGWLAFLTLAGCYSTCISTGDIQSLKSCTETWWV